MFDVWVVIEVEDGPTGTRHLPLDAFVSEYRANMYAAQIRTETSNKVLIIKREIHL